VGDSVNADPLKLMEAVNAHNLAAKVSWDPQSVAGCLPSERWEVLMIAILAELVPSVMSVPGVLAESPDRTFEVLLVIGIIAVAAVAAAISLRKG
jgi:hypothetical protein